jgi:hypothetical protein
VITTLSNPYDLLVEKEILCGYVPVRMVVPEEPIPVIEFLTDFFKVTVQIVRMKWPKGWQEACRGAVRQDIV